MASLNVVCQLCSAPLRAPKWYKRPAGVSFGFGGKLVSFHPKSSASGAASGASEVKIILFDVPMFTMLIAKMYGFQLILLYLWFSRFMCIT